MSENKCLHFECLQFCVLQFFLFALLPKAKIEDNRNLHFVFVFNCLIVFDSIALYSSRNNLRGITHKSPTSPNIAIYVCKLVHLVKYFSQLKFSLSVCLIRV